MALDGRVHFIQWINQKHRTSLFVYEFLLKIMPIMFIILVIFLHLMKSMVAFSGEISSLPTFVFEFQILEKQICIYLYIYNYL